MAPDKDFKRFLMVWAGQLMSAIGSGLTAFALGVYVFQETRSAACFSLVILFSFLPSFLLLPFGGVLADRRDRQKMMIIGDTGAITGLLLIYLALLSGGLELWHIYAGVAMTSAFTAIQGPAYKAAVSDLVAAEMYSRASGLVQLAGSAQYLISPVAAGFLLGFFDIQMVLVIDIITFLLAAGATLAAKPRETVSQKREEPLSFHDIADAWRYLLANRGILWLVLLTSMVCLYVGFLQSLFGPMMLTMAGPRTLGIALSVSASGMLASSLFIGLFGTGPNRVSAVSLSLALAGLFYSLMGVFPQVILITAFGFLFFAVLPFVNTSLEVLIRGNVDNGKQGRIWSLIAVVSQAGYVIAFGCAGFLADNLLAPLFYANGALSHTVGQVIGTGPGRGIGFLFVISGLLVMSMAIIIRRVKKISALEMNQLEREEMHDNHIYNSNGRHRQPGRRAAGLQPGPAATVSR